MARNTPEDALRGFYAAIVRDGDFEAACRYATPDFYLRPTNIVGANINADDPETPALPKPRTTPRRGPCAKLVARVQEKRGGLYPWSAWAVESVKVDKGGDSAEAVTMDGSAGLRVVDDEWRVAWVFDSY
jgi:hypothetical protein